MEVNNNELESNNDVERFIDRLIEIMFMQVEDETLGVRKSPDVDGVAILNKEKIIYGNYQQN
jgi:hypothetical protein